jgi:hypothetical protein
LTKITENYAAIISSILIGLMVITAILIGSRWLLISARWIFLFLVPLFVIFAWIYYPIFTKNMQKPKSILVVIGVISIAFCFCQFLDFLFIAILEFQGYAKFGLYVFVIFNSFLIAVPLILNFIKGKKRNKILKDLGLSEFHDYTYTDLDLGGWTEKEFNEIKMDLEDIKETEKIQKDMDENFIKTGEERNKN